MTRLAIVKKDKCNLLRCSFLCGAVCPVNRNDKDCIKNIKTYSLTNLNEDYKNKEWIYGDIDLRPGLDKFFNLHSVN